VKLPVEALPVATIINGDVAVLPDGGVIGVGSVNVTPVGADPTQEADRSTAELSPLIEVTVIVAVLLPPCVTGMAAREDEIEKSGVATGVTVRPNAYSLKL
jgi:hypothetical protein